MKAGVLCEYGAPLVVEEAELDAFAGMATGEMVDTTRAPKVVAF